MKKTVRYFAFLRAINVGGHRVKMERLCEIFTSLGFQEVSTFIASGNVIFHAPVVDVPDALTSKIETALKVQLGYDISVFLRTDKELAALSCCTPFPPSMMEGAIAYNIAFLSSPLQKAELEMLQQLHTEIDSFAAVGSEVHWLCRRKQSESKFSNQVFEKSLQRRATFRGRQTLLNLLSKYPAPTESA